jgi:hypothetical protein
MLLEQNVAFQQKHNKLLNKKKKAEQSKPFQKICRPLVQVGLRELFNVQNSLETF